jgi:hypothetical protein
MGIAGVSTSYLPQQGLTNTSFAPISVSDHGAGKSRHPTREIRVPHRAAKPIAIAAIANLLSQGALPAHPIAQCLDRDRDAKLTMKNNQIQ